MKGFTLRNLGMIGKPEPNNFGEGTVYTCNEDYCPFGFFVQWELITTGRQPMEVIKEHYREAHYEKERPL